MTLLMLQRRPQGGGAVTALSRQQLCDLIITPYFWPPRPTRIVFTHRSNGFGLRAMSPMLDIDATHSMLTVWGPGVSEFCSIPMDLSTDPNVISWGPSMDSVGVAHGDYALVTHETHLRMGNLSNFPESFATMILPETHERAAVYPSDRDKVCVGIAGKIGLFRCVDSKAIPYKSFPREILDDGYFGDHVRGRRHFMCTVDGIDMIPIAPDWNPQKLDMERGCHRRIWYADDQYVIVGENWHDDRSDTMVLVTFQPASVARIRRGKDDPIMTFAWKDVANPSLNMNTQAITIVDQRWIWVIGIEAQSMIAGESPDDDSPFSWRFVIDVYSLVTGAAIERYGMQGPWNRTTALPWPHTTGVHDRCIYALHTQESGTLFVTRWDVIH